MTNDAMQQRVAEIGLEMFYCVHYYDIAEIRWVRNPFCEWEQVEEIIESLPYQYDKETDKIYPLFERFTILPEARLSELAKRWNDEKADYEYEEITNRQIELDSRYESTAESFSGMRSLSRKSENSHAWVSIGEQPETLEEWKARVEETEKQADKADEEKYELRSRLRELYRKENGAPNPFLTGNCTFRREMEDADLLRKQVAEYKLKKALENKGFKD